ncbi:MAG: hypothetical protein ACOWWR_16535 [Eubacteriales bacterium]
MGDVSMDVVHLEDVELLLNKINGIINTRVVRNEHNLIVEIHILANTLRFPKQIIRDVQSVLMTMFNIKIDHKIISIAQVYDDDESFTTPRLMIKSVEYTSFNMSGKAKVVLEYDHNIYIGESEGIHSSKQAYRLVSTATLHAVELFLDNAQKFIVEEIKIVDICERDVVISGVTLVTKDTEKLLIGKCIVENDVNSAIAKGVLDAVNRMLQVK